jgi:hypothetical protein
MAYLTKDKTGRMLVLLFNSKTSRSTISYAKYLMCCQLDRVLDKEDLVVHDNLDVTDDSPSNLKLTTKSEHSARVNVAKKSKDLKCLKQRM